MSEWSRIKCEKCGNENPRKLHEEPKKDEVIYYSMQGTPVYAKNMKCGECGHIWKKE